MYGPPGTGKTLIARACAAETNPTFLKLSATQLSQHFNQLNVRSMIVWSSFPRCFKILL